MIYVPCVLVPILIAWAIWRLAAPYARRATERASKAVNPKTARPGGHDWDKRTHQLYRQAKGISGPEEAREAITAFLDTHVGVEAYVEPKTVVSPLTVLLVDGAGEAKRFPLNEDALLRELAKTRGLPVFDATRVGYPERMRRRRDTAAG